MPCCDWLGGCFAGGTVSAMGPSIGDGSRRLRRGCGARLKRRWKAARVAVVPRRQRRALRSSKWKRLCGPSCASKGSSRRTTGRNCALRHAVIWRRISGGTDSADGSRFVERMLTVVATCRQQKRNVLDYLSSCFEAHLRGHKVPSLLPAK